MIIPFDQISGSTDKPACLNSVQSVQFPLSKGIMVQRSDKEPPLGEAMLLALHSLEPFA